MTRLTLNRSSRLLGVAVVSVASAGLLTGCGQWGNPYTTELHYNAADGTSATVAGLNAENLLIVNDGKSSTGQMQGMVYNPGSNDATVSFTLAGATKTITVPAGESLRLDGKANGNDTAKASPVTLSSIAGAKPGDEVAVTVKSGSASSSVQVPVVLDQPPYGTASPTHPADKQGSEEHDVAVANQSK